jgi:hypothetical protein
MFFGWSGRTLSRLQNQTAVREFLESQQLKPGWYGYPEMSEQFDTMTKEEQTAEWERVAELYKQGPAAYIIVPPAGEDMMSSRQLGLEALANFLSALLVAGILYLASVWNLWTRWLIAVAIGVVGWIEISASHHIWYRFPWSFTRDELLCVLFEWALAGLVIAAIVRPRAEGPSVTTAG